LTVSEFISTWNGTALKERFDVGATAEATAAFSALSRSLQGRGHPPQVASRFLIRLLFCFFADAVDLFPGRMFRRMIRNFLTKPARFEKALTELFEVMSTGGYFGVDDIAHFKGSLFAATAVLLLTRDDLAILWDCTRFDWKRIGPSIFDTVFEPTLDFGDQFGGPSERCEDILLIVSYLSSPCNV
jgi:hypothetical protein